MFQTMLRNLRSVLAPTCDDAIKVAHHHVDHLVAIDERTNIDLGTCRGGRIKPMTIAKAGTRLITKLMGTLASFRSRWNFACQ